MRDASVLAFLTTGLLLAASFPVLAEEPTQAEKLFALQVHGILREKCLGCHGGDPEKVEGAFDVRSRDSVLKGGESFGGEVLIPGKAASSKLLAAISRTEEGYAMPPKDADRLSEEEVWAVRDWINAGAPWPTDERVAEIYRLHADGIAVQTSGGTSEAWTSRKYKREDLWAFQPLQADFDVFLQGHAGNPIDRFIDHEIAARGLTPAPLADRRTLIRRATFDLTGLPPHWQRVREFVDDPRNDDEVYRELIEELLASPHYGEQWGQHWLDVTRYADSSGYANDWERPNAWRYRDYVIRSFNEDKPFHEFVLEQIAGDELVEQAKLRGTPLNEQTATEHLIAVGFLRMGPWEHTGMSVAKVTRQLFLDDVTDAVGQVFLGQALQCCRCHDHKFDPIPTRDYYSFQACFATTQFAEVDTPWLDEENLAGMEDDLKYHRMKHQSNEESLKQFDSLQKDFDSRWFAERNLPFKTRAEARKAGHPIDDMPPSVEMTPEQFGRERIARKWQARYSWEFDRYKPVAMTVYNGGTREPPSNLTRFHKPNDPAKAGTIEQTAILPGGDPFSPSTAVSPGVLSAVPSANGFSVPETFEGRRLALANWIVNPDNTLSSRVIVNRIWAGHFGRGLAGNPNNFGATGKKPTHPELLDWLAVEFMKHGRSIKHLHRLIVTSQAYRRGTLHPDMKLVEEKDVDGSTYCVFQPRRLTAEELRDAMLAVTDELNPEQGGMPVRPDMNLEAALQPRMIMGTFAPSYVPHPLPEQRNRRSIYTHKTRGQRLPFFETFNQPGSETSCELRDQSNITPQVFTLLNSDETNDRALALAVRCLKDQRDEGNVVALAMERCWGRRPDHEEISSALAHWQAMIARHEQSPPPPKTWPTEVTREAIDENTGKPFTFTEPLFVYHDYVPDPQPHKFAPRTRALADVCLMLLNSNEFVYVY